MDYIIQPTEAEMSTSETPIVKSEPSQTLDLEMNSNGNSELMELKSNHTPYLEQLINQSVPEILESGVSIGVDLLQNLTNTLNTSQNPDVVAWLQRVKQLNESASPTRTVVGVVGNTGAGKSSVINALIDEERLLPTNCLRACTASPTEISWNYSDDPSALYQAEIEFVSAEDWLRELEVLFSDLLDPRGEVSKEASNPDTEAGVAYAKLKAVYPTKTKEMISQGTPERFANEPAVRGVLGSVKTLKEKSAKDLYGRLQRYVDSNEKLIGNDSKQQTPLIEYWPLIKVIRIFTKADALSTGAVIVDLPGVQDSNAARAAVASNYLMKCTGLWIVAPITRAVDDKTAKSLLGDSFKRQLKYDGTYSAVTFICSKTDDISVTEAADSLNLVREVNESYDKIEELKESKAKKQTSLKKLKDAKAACAEKIEEIEIKHDAWEGLLNQAKAGQTVYAPSDNPKKRKRRAKPRASRKSRVADRSGLDNDWEASEDDSSGKENSQTDQPLSAAAVEEEMASLKALRKTTRGEQRSLDARIENVRKEIREVEHERQEIPTKIKAACIQGRNDYSRGAIKQDFAMGIKELDQENAGEETELTFNPDEDIRDYEEVARALPVFCVSSRAYQKLSGRLQKDGFRSHGFLSVKDTEIPQLQQHAKKLTEAGRLSHCRRFLNDLTQLVNSLKLWAADDGTQTTLTDGGKRYQKLELLNLLSNFQKGFDGSVCETMQLLHRHLDEQIYRVFDTSIPLAVDAAPAIAESWGAPRTMGGLPWSTYKATVRRQGSYSGCSGPRDFNQELWEPVSRDLASGWDRGFQNRIPALLEDFLSQTKKQLQEFHKSTQALAQKRHTDVSGMATLRNQMLTHTRRLEQLPASLRAITTESSREANRAFVPVIRDLMRPAYDATTNENGLGSYGRMKVKMRDHVANIRHTMFRTATDTVKKRLQDMCRDVQKQMGNEMNDMSHIIFSEYMKVFVGTTVNRTTLSPKELAIRANVNDVLQCDSLFASAFNQPVKKGPEEMEGVVSTECEVADDAMQGIEYGSTRADELMQQQIRAQSQTDDESDYESQ